MDVHIIIILLLTFER